jgi:hypothetical protein
MARKQRNCFLGPCKRVVRTTEARVVQLGVAVQRGFEPASREISIVRSRYQEAPSGYTADWKKLSGL